MKRLFALVAGLLLLTACSSARQSGSRGESASGNLKTFGPRSTSQSPATKPAEQTAIPSESASTQKTVPAAVLQSPTPPAAAPTTETPCTWPTPATLQAKGSLLLADGPISFYQMAWGAGCAYVDQQNTWVAQGNGTPMPLLREIRNFQGVQVAVLPGGEHGYLINGGATGAATSAYYLMVLRNGDQRLVTFIEGHGPATESIASTDYPRIKGDEISAAERVGTGSEMHYNLSTWKLDTEHLYATKVSKSVSYPSKTP